MHDSSPLFFDCRLCYKLKIFYIDIIDASHDSEEQRNLVTVSVLLVVVVVMGRRWWRRYHMEMQC